MCRRSVQRAVIRLARVEEHRGCISARRCAEDVRLVDVAWVVAVVAGDEGDLVVGDGELVCGTGEVDLPGQAYGLFDHMALVSDYGSIRCARGER